MNTRPVSPLRRVYAWIALLSVFTAAHVHSATRTWDGGGNDWDWRTAANWDGTIRLDPIEQGDTLVFPEGRAKVINTNDFGVNTNFNSLIYSGDNYQTYGNRIGLSNGVSVTHASGATALHLPILLRKDQTFSVSSANAFLHLFDEINIGIYDITFDGAGSTVLLGEISNSRFGTRGRVFKTGSGRLTIFQQTDHDAPTIVNGGTLAVENRMTNSIVTVQSSGTLRGSSRIGGLNAIGGLVFPGGTTPDALEIRGDATLGAGSTLRIRLNGTSPGVSYDQLDVVGTVTLGGTLDLVFGYTPAVGDKFTIIENDGSDDITGVFAGMPEGHVFTANGRPFKISYGGRIGPFGRENDVTIEAIPALAIWDRGADPNNLWSQPINWSNDVIPGLGDDIQFPQGNSGITPLITSNDFPAGRLFGSLLIGPGDHRLIGNNVQFDGRIETFGSAFSDTIDIHLALSLRGGILHTNWTRLNLRAPLTLLANQTFRMEHNAAQLGVHDSTVLNGHTLRVDSSTTSEFYTPYFNGPLVGPGELVKAGPGSLALSNAISCPLVVEEGTLIIGSSAGGSAAVTVEPGGVLRLPYGYFQVSDLDVQSGGTFVPEGSPTLNGQTYLRSGSVLTIEVYTGSYQGGGSYTANHRCVIPNNADIDITGCDLQLTIDPNASRAQSFVIIDRYYNDGRVTGSFAGLPEGTVFIRGDRAFTITYRGGDDNNDVIVSPVTQFVWDGLGADFAFSTAGNWNPDFTPPAYSHLLFPPNDWKRTAVNDMTIPFSSMRFDGAGFGIGGNRLSLTESLLCYFAGDVVIYSEVAFSGGATIDVADTARLLLEGTLSANGTKKRGSGTIRLGGTNSTSGSLIVEAGVVELAKTIANRVSGTLTISTGSVRLLEDDQLADTMDVTILSNGRFELNGQDEILDTLSGDGVVELSERLLRSGRLTLRQGTFSGRFTGNGILTKTSSSLLTLNGTSSFTGTTVLQQGELRMDGIHSNSPIRLDGGTLTGRGYVGPLNGNLGGTVWPGLGGAQLNSALHTRDINFNSTTTFRPVLTSSSPDFEGHKLQVNGTVSLGNCRLLIDTYNNFQPTNGARFVIIDNDGTDPIVGTFAGLPQNGTLAGEGLLFQVSYTGGTGNDVTLTRVSAPPSTVSGFQRLPDGRFRLEGQGISGLRYQLQSTLSLNPVIQWQQAGAVTAGVNGIFQIEFNYGSQPPPRRFYRAISP